MRIAIVLALLLAGCTLPEPSPAPSSETTPTTEPTTQPTTSTEGTPPGTGGAPLWRRHAEAPTPRTEVAVATLGPLILVAGGFGPTGAATDVVEIFDTATGEWSAGPPLPRPLHHAMAIAFQGQALVLGGYDASGAPRAEVYRLGETGWARAEDMPTARAAGAIALAGEEIVVAGGVGEGGRLSPAAHVYDGAAWRDAPDLPRPRDHLAAASLDGKAYFVGGRLLGLDQNKPWLDVFDGNAWTALGDMPTARGGLAAAATNDSVVVVGGEQPDSTFDEAEAYSPATQTWTALPALPTARHGLGAAFVDGRVYALLGGERPGGGAGDVVESYGAT